MASLFDMFAVNRDPTDPDFDPAWNERPTRPGGLGSVAWTSPHKYALLSAAAQMAQNAGPRRTPQSTSGTLAELAGSLAGGLTGATQYQQQVEREDTRRAAVDVQRQNQLASAAAEEEEAYRNFLWTRIPDDDPLFAGLSPEQISSLKTLTYEKGSQALGRYRMATADPGVTVNVAAGQPEPTEFEKAMAKTSAARISTGYEEAQAGVDLASRARLMLNQLLSGQVDTGAIQGATLPVRQIAASMGLIGSKDVGQEEFFRSMSDYISGRLRVPGSGATSDFEARLFLRQAPALTKTVRGNMLIAGTMIQAQKRDARLAEAREAYARERNGSQVGFEAWAEEQGLFETYPQVSTADEVAALPRGTVFIWVGDDTEQVKKDDLGVRQ